MSIEINRFLEITKKLEDLANGKREEFERLKRFFERFHMINRNYLDRESFEKAQESISSIAETIAGTINFLSSEISRLKNKRMKLPFENVSLAEMQKIQRKNEMLIKDYISNFIKPSSIKSKDEKL
jgi:hypothetical protein